MYSIAFDISGQGCSIALLKEEKTVSSFVKPMEFGQAEVLIVELGNMLRANKLSFKDIALVTVCVGPGSFTGVRSGIAAARALGIADEKIKIIGVNAFDAYICSFGEVSEVNAVIIETKRDDFYYQLFDKNLKKITEPDAASREEIIKLIGNRKVSFIGDGVERFLFQPSGLQINHIEMTDYLDIEKLALCGVKRFKDKVFDYPKPLYIRAPDVRAGDGRR